MKMDEQEVRELLRLRSPRTEAGAASCLAPDVLTALTLGKLSAEERRRSVAHLADCDDCSAELRLIESLKPWAERAAATHPLAGTAGATPIVSLSAAGFPRRTAARWLALAAMLAVAAGLALLLRRSGAPLENGSYEVRGEATISTGIWPQDGARLAAPPDRLEWLLMPDSAGYEVVLYDVQMMRLWHKAGLTDPSVELPADLRGRLERGRSYYWAVFTQTPAGRRESPLHRFEIER